MKLGNPKKHTVAIVVVFDYLNSRVPFLNGPNRNIVKNPQPCLVKKKRSVCLFRRYLDSL